MKLGSLEIAKMYTGATEVTKAYLGSVLVYGTTGPIETTVSDFTNDNALVIVPTYTDQNLHIKLKFRWTNDSSEYRFLMEKRTSTTDQSFTIAIDNNGFLNFNIDNAAGVGISNKSAATVSLNTNYEMEGYVDRAIDKTVLKYREIGSDTWIESQTDFPSGTVLIDTNDPIEIGYGAWWASGTIFHGYIWDVEFVNYLTIPLPHTGIGYDTNEDPVSLTSVTNVAAGTLWI